MLRIDRISLIEVANTLVTPFHASSHAARALHHILVRIESADGAVGWGECPTLDDPYYVGETTETAWYILREFLAPRVLGAPWSTIDDFAALMAPVKSNPFAKSGLEMAAWDLFGRTQGKSLSELLSGVRTEIASGVALGMDPDTPRLLDAIQRHVEEGYRRVKLKVAPSSDHADVALLAQVRARFPHLPLMVDANGAYTLGDAPHLAAFDAFDLTMIEQPLDDGDLLDHAALQARIRTPICLDESLRSAPSSLVR